MRRVHVWQLTQLLQLLQLLMPTTATAFDRDWRSIPKMDSTPGLSVDSPLRLRFGGPSEGHREPRKRWRQTSTSVSSSVSSAVHKRHSEPRLVATRLLSRPGVRADISNPTGPPLDLHPTTERLLFSNKRHFSNRPTVGAPSLSGPPSLPGPPSRPPAPNIWVDPNSVFSPGPPFPPSVALPPSIPLPPAIPQPPATPRPPPPPLPLPPRPITVTTIRPVLDTEDAHVSDIRCVVGRFIGTFDAVLTLPTGFSATPLLHDKPSVDLSSDQYCGIRATTEHGQFELRLIDLDRCGVKECSENNKLYLCLAVRFPVLPGLQLPEDQLASVRCEPQDPTAEKTPEVNLATSRHVNSEREASLFEGGGQTFKCEIAIYRKNPTTGYFTDRVLEGTELDLGEEVQLWSVVQENDGWLHSRLVEVVVHRAGAEADSSPRNKAVLVSQDGCVNPHYTAIAKDRPLQDFTNPLVNKFTFRVFLFQDMQPGESVTIRAKVIGCVMEEDCQFPAECPDTQGLRRRREIREAANSTTTSSSSTTTAPKLTPPPLHHLNYTTDWSRSIAINVRNPQSSVSHQQLTPPQCQVYLFLTVGVAVAFFLATVVFVIAILAKKRSQDKNSTPSSPSTSCVSITPVTTAHHVMGTNSGPGRRANNKTNRLMFPTNFTSHQTATRKNNMDSFCDGSERNSLSCQDDESYQNSSFDDDEQQQQFSWLPPPQMLVPATVRHRKRQLNTELLDTFRSERGHSGTMTLPSCPALLNYYGYMVVPRTAPVIASNSNKNNTGPRRRMEKTTFNNIENYSSSKNKKIPASDLLPNFPAATASDDEERQLRQRVHRQRYKKRQRHGDRSRARSVDTRENHKSANNKESHQIKIDVPPPPPPSRPPHLPKPAVRRNLQQNIYEVPIESKPVMV